MAVGKNGYGGRKYSNSSQTTHAEICALQNVVRIPQRKRKRFTLFSVAYDGQEFRMSMPCSNCCHSLLNFGIRKVIYNDGTQWIEDEITNVVALSKLSSGDQFCKRYICSK